MIPLFLGSLSGIAFATVCGLIVWGMTQARLRIKWDRYQDQYLDRLT